MRITRWRSRRRASRSPISPFRARGLTALGRAAGRSPHYVRCARLAQRAGYDGVEIMGSEGYLINQFVAPQTNHRDDEWGGSFENRIRFPVEIVRRTRAAVGPNFIIIYRLSMLDLVEGGSTWDEVVALAQAVEAAGATIINTGIGWHEARIPTIATMVPRAAFAWVTRRLKGEVKIPLITTNRINDPGDGRSGARARRRRHGVDGAAVPRRRRLRQQGRAGPRRRDQHLHRLQPGVPRPDLRAADRVVPRQSVRVPRDRMDVGARRATQEAVAVVGAGPAGLACATTAAERGHDVTLFDAAAEIGGQFNLARRIPGKEEFAETLRYLPHATRALGVHVRTGPPRRVRPISPGSTTCCVATGIVPRTPSIPGIDHPKVASYVDIVNGRARRGRRVAIDRRGRHRLRRGASSSPPARRPTGT